MRPLNEMKGVWTNLVTPFAHDGSLDWSAFDRLLDTQLQYPITGLVVGGIVGEAHTLSSHEKLALIRRTKARLNGRGLVMAGVAEYNTAQARELAKLSQDAGADSLLITIPSSIKAHVSGLIKHFETIAEGLSIGSFADEQTFNKDQDLSASEITNILKLPGVIGLQLNSGNISKLAEIRNNTQKIILSGQDSSLLGSLAQGADGIVSSSGQLFPKQILDCFNYFHKGEILAAKKIFFALYPFIQNLHCEINPAPVKACLSHEGFIQNQLRLPLDCLKGIEFEQMIAGLNEAKSRLEG